RTPSKPRAETPAPVWPAAGSAEVDLSAGRSARRAGTSPVSVGKGTGAGGARLSKVDVEIVDRATVPPRWRSGLVARVSAPSGAATGSASLAVDYSRFKAAYGADWASRLRLWSLPDCALTSPEKPQCSPTPLASHNDPVAATVTAETPVRSQVRSVSAL